VSLYNRDVPLCDLIAQDLQASCPLILENDANAALLAECWAGAAKGKRNVVMITLGTGIGGGAVVDGQLLRGANGMAAEVNAASKKRCFDRRRDGVSLAPVVSLSPRVPVLLLMRSLCSCVEVGH